MLSINTERSRMPYGAIGEPYKNDWKIHQVLQEKGNAVVTGLPGSGKSRLAIEYAHRFCAHYPGGIFWTAACRKRIGLILQILEGIPDKGIDGFMTRKEQLNRIWQILDSFKPTLVIIDDFPEGRPFKMRFPVSSSVHTLITTRRRDVPLPGVHLEKMDAKAAIDLLNCGKRQFKTHAGALAEASGYLPLYIDMVKGLLNSDAPTEPAEMAVQIKTPTDILDMIYQRMSEPAEMILKIMSLLAPLPVPAEFIAIAAGIDFSDDPENPLDRILRELTGYGLIQSDNEGDPFMHELTAGYVRKKIQATDGVVNRVIAGMNQRMLQVYDDHDITDYSRFSKILPHAEHLVTKRFLAPEQSIQLYNCLLFHHQKWGRFRMAEVYGRKAVKVGTDSLGHAHRMVSAARSNLALVLKSMERFDESADLLYDALRNDERQFEPGHPNITATQSNLAMVLMQMGKTTESKELLETAFGADQNNFEPGSAAMAASTSNLALVLLETGDSEKACSLLRASVEAHEKRFPEGHPRLSILRCNLAVALKLSGILNKAKWLLDQALESESDLYPADHPAIKATLLNMASVLMSLGRNTDARELLLSMYRKLRKRVGAKHPSTKRIKQNLDTIYHEMRQETQSAFRQDRNL